MNFINILEQINKLKLLSLFIFLLSFSLLLVSFSSFSKPKITILHGNNLEGFARTQVKNETSKELACWVAIDGFKQKFRLPPATTSQWFTANDKRFTYSNFSTWCDFIEFYPKYKNYRVGGKEFG